LNAVLDNTVTLIQSREDRDRIQQSIMKLLDEVSGVATGDLTVEAEVTADMTGAIADSFNLMLSELRQIIGTVKDTTSNSVRPPARSRPPRITCPAAANRSRTDCGDLSRDRRNGGLDPAGIRERQRLGDVAQQSLSNARQGSQAVQKTMDGMNSIREQVSETAKRIKRLGESSQEIGEIIQLIGDIADRTSILALNASIQAAMAGDAGRGFAVVAEEVERLAVRSTEATKRVASLVKTIQTETAEAVSAMEGTTSEVVRGTKLANEGGKALVEIESVSNRLAELMQSISLAAKQQARGSEALAKSMSEISDITQQTAAGTKQSAVSIANLSSLADELRESVSRFKLPAA
jgi:twitching motility protein PilJ